MSIPLLEVLHNKLSLTTSPSISVKCSAYRIQNIFTNAVITHLYISTSQLKPTVCPQGVSNIEKAHKQRKTLQSYRVFSNIVNVNVSLVPIPCVQSSTFYRSPAPRMNALLN
ncbi:hypothetical protein NP493_64g06089 [Ridgeia piscesae]|uniref:Uncharacterized protein n=1 Tax=Ridgeia piscesae TaxID=27915 RepID=A0AAD9UIU8_RIDPI|nr:hypothetical protein NP493_64g06089 [Ridgeia piscesae]